MKQNGQQEQPLRVFEISSLFQIIRLSPRFLQPLLLNFDVFNHSSQTLKLILGI
jgi:hypothetical protein